ncbi:DMT family transporter [Marinobacterium jannaschii]|uniref:DMT family transporter n=1 Tax=Marinobacterium jannaschii TaxID=64970 RepID=UPI0004861BF9|nr:DMT family transporter [Marinobacterium jannaschii]
MNLISLSQLLLLAAIWGASFMFMRIGAPVLGPAWLIEFRVLFAALFLLLVAMLLRRPLQARRYWQHYGLLGLFNSALPFLLLAYAAQSLTASLLSILNAAAPIFGAVLGAVWFRKPLSQSQLIGLLLGICGVALLVGLDQSALQSGSLLAVIAALGAALSYGIASVYAQSAPSVAPFSNAHGSMWSSTLLILPLLAFSPLQSAPPADIMASVVALGVICTGIAYLLYFRLIADIGAASALTVTFLVPVFGVLWGVIFLQEQLGWHTLAGAILVVLGTAKVTGFRTASLKYNKAA